MGKLIKFEIIKNTMGEDQNKVICGGVCCLVSLTVILVLMAYGAVEPTEYGILRSKIT